MSGLYVPLDVEYDSDDGFLVAGPMAELLYVRGMAFCKRTGSDGVISRSQLAIVGHGIPALAKHAQKLVDVDKWTITATGWHVRAWLKRNKAAAEISAEKEMRRAASALANHERWHVGEGKSSVRCPHCYPKSDPTSDSKKGKPEGEPKGRDNDRAGLGATIHPLRPATAESSSFDQITKIAGEAITQKRVRDRGDVLSPRKYAEGVATILADEQADFIRERQALGDTAVVIAGLLADSWCDAWQASRNLGLTGEGVTS